MIKQLHWSGIPCIIGGIVFPFALLQHPIVALGQIHNTPYTLVHVLAGTALGLLLVGLFALYARSGTGMKPLGRFGVLIASIGTVFEIAYLLIDGFGAPTLALASPAPLQGVDAHAVLLKSLGPVGMMFLLFELCFVVGYLMLALAKLDAHVFPRWTGVWLLSGALLFGLQTLLPQFVVDLGAALLGLGFIEMGFVLFFKRRERGDENNTPSH